MVAPPVTKVGAIILRVADNPQGYEVLVCQPKPKLNKDGTQMKPGMPPLGPPRGTRKWLYKRGGLKQWVDAEDALHTSQMKPKDDSVWEPLLHAMMMEVEEEAGVPYEVMREQSVYELGELTHQSSDGGTKPIHWFVVVLDRSVSDKLPTQGWNATSGEPFSSENHVKDSAYTQWMTVAAYQELCNEKNPEKTRGNESYLPVMNSAIDGIQSGELKAVAPEMLESPFAFTPEFAPAVASVAVGRGSR